jgi:hypothetical protein
VAFAGGFEERGPCLDGLPQRLGEQRLGIGFGLMRRFSSLGDVGFSSRLPHLYVCERARPGVSADWRRRRHPARVRRVMRITLRPDA